MKIVTVIPARFGAERLPGKPLADIRGKPMIQHVYEAAIQARGISQTLVATDDERIVEAVRKFGGEVLLTSRELKSGTDRVAAVADLIRDGKVFLNVQGDEPLIEPSTIEAALALVISGKYGLSSAMTKLLTREELLNPSVVKVLADQNGRAIYFSRFPIPYSRQEVPAHDFACFRHLGIYVYRREVLMKFRLLPPSPFERGESLEQLRVLDSGIPIGLARVESRSIGVDTEEDLKKVRALL